MSDVMDAANGSTMFEDESMAKKKKSFANPLDDGRQSVDEGQSETSAAPAKPAVKLGRFASIQGSSSDMIKAHRESYSYDEHDPKLVAKMKALFETFDTDGDGSIDAQELQAGLESSGVRISPVDSRTMLKSIDRVGTNGTINFDDFYDVMHRAGAATGDINDCVHAFVGVRGQVTGGSKLILECEEDEEHLAKPALGEGDDLFEILQQGLKESVPDPADGTEQADEVLDLFKMTDKNNNARLEPKELRAIVNTVMGANVVTDAVFENLFRQIDVDDSGDITVGEFRDWWESRTEEDDSTAVNLDPQALALRKMEQQSNMISPNSRFRQRWDIFQACLLVYVAISVPYRVCFDDAAEVWGFFFCVDVMLDIYFLLDVFLNFRTAIITRDGEVVYEHKAVALRYLRSWFPIDFVSCLPFGYIHYVYPDTNNRAAKLFRLLKLLRLVRMKRILDRWEEELYSVGAVKLAKLIALIMLSSHWLCCGWYFVGCPLPDEEQTGWVVRSYPDDYETTPKEILYKDAAFWALMAVVMVGTEDKHGHRSPTLESEKVMFATSFMVGAVVVSLIDSLLHATLIASIY